MGWDVSNGISIGGSRKLGMELFWRIDNMYWISNYVIIIWESKKELRRIIGIIL